MIPLSLSSEFPNYTARILGENEPLHGASFPGTTCAAVCPLSSSGLRDPAAAICRILLSLFGELPKYTPRVLGENELQHGASFPGTCTVLLPSSLLCEAVPGLYTSLAGH